MSDDRVARNRAELSFIVPHASDDAVIAAQRELFFSDMRCTPGGDALYGEIWRVANDDEFCEIDRLLRAMEGGGDNAASDGRVDWVFGGAGAAVVRTCDGFRCGPRLLSEDAVRTLVSDLAGRWEGGSRHDTSDPLPQSGRRIQEVMAGGPGHRAPVTAYGTGPLQLWAKRDDHVARIPVHAMTDDTDAPPLGLVRPMAVNVLRSWSEPEPAAVAPGEAGPTLVYAPRPEKSFKSRGAEIQGLIRQHEPMRVGERVLLSLPEVEEYAAERPISGLVVHGNGSESEGAFSDANAGPGRSSTRRYWDLLQDLHVRMGRPLEAVVLDVCNSNSPARVTGEEERGVLDLLGHSRVVVATIGTVPQGERETGNACSEFVANFLEGFFARGLTAGEAMLAARIKDHEKGSRMWRHYCLYGDVNYRTTASTATRIGG